MGEIFMLVRGHIDHVEKFIQNLRSQWFPMKFKKKMRDEFGNQIEVETIENVDGQVRPYQLIGYVVPDDFIQPVMNNLGLPTNETWFDKKPGEQSGSFRSGFGVKGYLEALRLMLGANKIEKDLTKGFWHYPIYRKNVNVLGIGWRPDEKIKTILGEHDGI